jgi:PadR family transcriptional regulator AphA
VTGSDVRQTARPNKRVYAITNAGRDALTRWLHAPWRLARLRDESLVKLTLAESLPAAEVIDHMRHLKEIHERRRADVQARIDALPVDAGRYVRLALRKGVHAQAAFAALCQEVIDALRPRKRIDP